MTDKNKKILLICAAIFIGSYIVRYALTAYFTWAYQIHQPPPPPKKQAPDPVAEEAKAFGNFSGMWRGRAYLADRGACNLGLRLEQNQLGHYTAYSRFACLKPNGNFQDMLMHSLPNTEPDATILTGMVEKGAIHFKAEKNVDVDQCPMTELTITPFGPGAVIAEWNDCEQGKLLMQKEAR